MESIEALQRTDRAAAIAAARSPGPSRRLAQAMVTLAAIAAGWRAVDWLAAHQGWQSFRPWPPAWGRWPGTGIDLAWAVWGACPLIVALGLWRGRSPAWHRAAALVFFGLMAESWLDVARRVVGTPYSTAGAVVVAGRFVLAMLDYLVAVRAWRVARSAPSQAVDRAWVRWSATVGGAAFLAILIGGVVASSFQDALARVPWFRQLVFDAARWVPMPIPPEMERSRQIQEADYAINQALTLAGSGHYREARDAYRRAAATFESYLAHQPRQEYFKDRLALAQNNLAWLLVTCPDPALIDPVEALARSREAVALEPESGTYWNTVGVAEYRAGRLAEAAESLDRSIRLRDGGDPFDWFFLAMIAHRRGDPARARSWFDRAVQGREAQRPFDPELIRFHAEAADLLDLPGPTQTRQPRSGRPGPIPRPRLERNGGFGRPPMLATP